MKKRPERELAREMYRQGKNYKEIIAATGAAKSTVSMWCGDLATAKINQRIEQTAKRKQLAKQLAAERKTEYLAAEGPYAGWRYTEYVFEDGHNQLRLVNDNTGEIQRLSRLRYNMALSLGRMLKRGEQVRRIDENNPSSEVDNLRLYSPDAPSRWTAPKATKPCQVCDKDFIPSRALRRYCSEECRGKGSTPTTVSVSVKACRGCKKEYRATRENRNYCSVECHAKNGPKKVKSVALPKLFNTECVICEKEFMARQGVETCSTTCRAKLVNLIRQYG